MFSFVGIGLAMEYAQEGFKGIADYVTSDSNDDGIEALKAITRKITGVFPLDISSFLFSLTNKRP